MQNKIKILISLLFVAVFIWGISLFIEDTETLPSQEEILVDLTIIYSEEDEQLFQEEKITQGSSVLDLLLHIEELQVITEQFPGVGVFVKEIGGVKGTDNTYWQYFVNNNYAEKGAGDYILQDKDSVSWKLTDSYFTE